MTCFSRALVLAFLTATTASALQRARFVPGGLDPAKPRLVGVAGAVVPDAGMLGPFADLDADGDVEFLHGSRAYANDGYGVFRAGPTLPLALERRTGFFDANGDGRLDLLSRTHFYLGSDSGGFVDATADLPAGLVADAAVLADLDGDLDIDVLALARHPSPASVRLAFNDGAGHFSEGTLPPAPPSGSVVAGDVDGDLDLDVVLNGTKLWRNDGTGTFTHDAGAIPPGLGGKALLLEDLDGDSDLDLAFETRIGLNDGSGVFSLGASLPAPPQARLNEAILALDREGDGDADLVLLDSAAWQEVFYGPSPGDRLLENDGTAVFTATSALPAFTGQSRGGFAGDLDGDGDDDLLVESSNTFWASTSGEALRFSNHVSWNDGTGAFALFPRSSGTGAIGDLNGDGLLDGFSVDALALNGPPGYFTASFSLPPAPFNCGYDTLSVRPCLGDVDGDGDLDAYCAVQEEGAFCASLNLLWINDGAAAFTDESSTRLPQTPWTEEPGISLEAFLLPLDGDGDLDAACVRAEDDDGGGFTSCYVNDGTGVFTFQGYVGPATRAGAFGDLDGDGDADYFGACDAYSSSLPNGVYTNDGDAHFVALVGELPPHATAYAEDVALGDVEGDGDLDAYVSAYAYTSSERTFFLYVNAGTAQFSDEPARLPDRLASANFVDLDLDGDADLLGRDHEANSRLFVNDGHGSFAEGSWRIQPRAGAAFDLDLDGDPDSLHDRGLARHLESLGEPRIGKRHTFVVHGPAHTPYALRQSLASAQINLGSSGFLLIDPNQIVSIDGGRLDHDGEARVRFFVPHIPALIGFTSYWQAVVGTPPHGTNLAVTTISGL